MTESSKLPKATHVGDLKIGGSIIKCAVLADGTRLLTRTTFLKAIGRTGKAKGGRAYDDEFNIPVFISAKNLKPFVTSELVKNSTPVLFALNGRQSIGYKAELLPEVCGVFMDAADEEILTTNQKHIAQKCKALLRGFATVGIVALVDEVTGYQEVRNREALQQILDKYLRDYQAKWAKTFPDEFYKELFRLKSLPYNPISMKRPGVVGHWTNDIVYKRLAPGILNELKIRNPTTSTGRRKHRHHQWLSDDQGVPELKQHISNVTFLMKASRSWKAFQSSLQKAAPKVGDTLELPFEQIEEI